MPERTQAGRPRTFSFLRQPGFLRWCGRDPRLSARASRRGWLYREHVLPEVTGQRSARATSQPEIRGQGSEVSESHLPAGDQRSEVRDQRSALLARRIQERTAVRQYDRTAVRSDKERSAVRQHGGTGLPEDRSAVRLFGCSNPPSPLSWILSRRAEDDMVCRGEEVEPWLTKIRKT